MRSEPFTKLGDLIRLCARLRTRFSMPIVNRSARDVPVPCGAIKFAVATMAMWVGSYPPSVGTAQAGEATETPSGEKPSNVARRIMDRLDQLATRPPGPTPPWASWMGEPDPIPVHPWIHNPDGSLVATFGGIGPTEFIIRMRQLSFSGKLSWDEYMEFRKDIRAIPGHLYRVP